MNTYQWTVEEIRALGVTTDVVTAGSIFGIGRDKARRLARIGDFPCPVIKTGSTYVVPVAGILRALLADDEGAAPTAAPLVLADRSAAIAGGPHG